MQKIKVEIEHEDGTSTVYHVQVDADAAAAHRVLGSAIIMGIALLDGEWKSEGSFPVQPTEKSGTT